MRERDMFNKMAVKFCLDNWPSIFTFHVLRQHWREDLYSAFRINHQQR